MGTLTRRRSFKVTKGLARMCSSKLRRPATRKGFVGAEQKEIEEVAVHQACESRQRLIEKEVEFKLRSAIKLIQIT